ncbi:MAG: hypothetical protein AB7J28_00425 [Hyphomonadaceae bacterium]
MRLNRFYRGLRDAVRRAPRLGLRRRFVRWARMSIAFALTIGVIALIAAFVVAARSGVHAIDSAIALEVEPGRSASVQAVERVFALSADDESAFDEARLFAPAAQLRRERLFQAGAEEAAIAFLGEVEVAAGAEAPALLELRAELETDGTLDRGRIREALSRLAAAAARGDVRLRAMQASLTEIALARLGARQRALSARVAESGRLFTSDEDERAFYGARGEAYAWALTLRGAARDFGARFPEAALGALDRAGAYQPLFVMNGSRGAALVPNHLAILALDLADAEAALAQ